MIGCERLCDEHVPALYAIARVHEPFVAEMLPTVSHYRAAITGFEGVVLMDDGRVFGAVLFSGLVPLTDVVLHAVVEPEYRGQWAIPAVNRAVWGLPFGEWDLPRVSSFTIRGVTDAVERPLEHFGFRLEGMKRQAILLPDGYHDVRLFGLLREDCRWL